MMSEDDEPKLGPCCICETKTDVVNVLMLPQRNLIPGHGWGCVVCYLPNDGAVAVLCNRCLESYRADRTPLRFFCRGYPASDGRAPIADLPQQPFDHDESAHMN
jgi:hypothetical protein